MVSIDRHGMICIYFQTGLPLSRYPKKDIQSPAYSYSKIKEMENTHTHTQIRKIHPQLQPRLMCGATPCLQGVYRDNSVCYMVAYAHMEQSVLTRQRTYWLRDRRAAANCSSEALTYLKQRKRPLIKHSCLPQV